MSDQVFNFATVGAVYADGVTLIFDGESEPTEKHYKCNTSVKFAAGDRVKILADSGTYVVEYVVGAPKTSGGGIDATTLNGKTEGQLSVSSASTAKSAGSATRANQIINQSNTDGKYDLYFRASSATTLQFKYGTYGQWRTITTTA
jgi:hypothetical protein